METAPPLPFDPHATAERIYHRWVSTLVEAEVVTAAADIPEAWRYEAADIINNYLVEQMKAAGLLRRVEDISDEWEQDDHFDALTLVYKLTCGVFRLPWPPPDPQRPNTLISPLSQRGSWYTLAYGAQAVPITI